MTLPLHSVLPASKTPNEKNEAISKNDPQRAWASAEVNQSEIPNPNEDKPVSSLGFGI
jgi:hypothetical protein